MPFRSHSEEELDGVKSLDDYLIKNPEASFILRMKGESMTEAGILPGDLVIVERGKVPKRGDIIVLFRDGEYVMRHFDLREMRIQGDIKIEAVVTSIIRSYQ